MNKLVYNWQTLIHMSLTLLLRLSNRFNKETQIPIICKCVVKVVTKDLKFCFTNKYIRIYCISSNCNACSNTCAYQQNFKKIVMRLHAATNRYMSMQLANC